ncbi:MBL fold metallo-hydrolase [archaeon]|nr:MAG: MBL fold metallo-hydrolase [archaeon]
MEKTTITCLCDNTVKYSSTYWGEHGISFLIEAGERTVLFDTGQSYPVLTHNAASMKKELTHVDDVIISHGHYDHTGGLSGLLSLCNPTVHAQPLVFEKKYQVYDGVNPTYIGMPIDRDTIESRSTLSLDKDSVEVTPTSARRAKSPATSRQRRCLNDSRGMMAARSHMTPLSMINRSSLTTVPRRSYCSGVHIAALSTPSNGVRPSPTCPSLRSQAAPTS